MRRLDRILCRVGLHIWSPQTVTETELEPITGHEVLDSIEDTLIVETRTRACVRCKTPQVKQTLKW